jgi:hypothetical protein
MAKSDYYIDKVTKKQAEDILLTYHYLKDISKGYKSGYNYGLFKHNDFCPLNIGGPVGICIFTGLPVPEVAQGAFGLERNEQEGLYELSRLCIHPETQLEERLSNCERKLLSRQSFPMLIAITILVQSIALAILHTRVSRIEKKTSIIQTELNILVEKSKTK